MINKIIAAIILGFNIHILTNELPSGLFNKGNTCYMNAAIQCIYNIFPLTDFLLARKNTEFYKEKETITIKQTMEIDNQEIIIRVPKVVNTVAYEYLQLIEKLKSNQNTPVDPINFCKKMWPALGNDPGVQGDADEFITVLLERLLDRDITKTPETIYYGFPFNFIPKGMPGELFYGIDSSILTDKRSDFRRPLTRKENSLYNKLSIPIIDKPESAPNVSLENCLKNYFSATTMEDAPNFTRKIELLTLPSYLIITLKRFTGDNFAQIKKNNELVTIPINSLNMKPYLAENANGQDAEYQLVSFVQHGGQMDGGHYNAYIKYNNQWFFCDDTSTSKFDTIDLFETTGSFDNTFTPYVLIYKKIGEHLPVFFEPIMTAAALKQQLEENGISNDLLTAYAQLKRISIQSLVDGINQKLVSINQIISFIINEESNLKKNNSRINSEMLFSLLNQLRILDMIILEQS